MTPHSWRTRKKILQMIDRGFQMSVIKRMFNGLVNHATIERWVKEHREE